MMRLWFVLMAAACLGLSQAQAATAKALFHGEVDSADLGFSMAFPDTVDSGSSATPLVIIRNFGLISAGISIMRFRIEDAYSDSIGPLELWPGETAVAFHSFQVNLAAGWHTAACTAFAAPPDSESWGLTQDFYVRLPTALTERHAPAPSSRPAGYTGPTVIRGVLQLGPSAVGRQSSAVLLDISGRSVARLNPGRNDVSRFKPGVYLLRLQAGNCAMTEKLVLLGARNAR